MLDLLDTSSRPPLANLFVLIRTGSILKSASIYHLHLPFNLAFHRSDNPHHLYCNCLQAEAHRRRAMAICQQLLGSLHARTLACLDAVLATLRRGMKLEKARSLLLTL